MRKLFGRCKIPYRSVDLDSVAYQQGNMGGKIRAALKQHTSIPTIPQIFVGGKFIGGCTETFDAFKDGSLQTLLKENQVVYDEAVKIDPYSLLPNWLQPR